MMLVGCGVNNLAITPTVPVPSSTSVVGTAIPTAILPTSTSTPSATPTIIPTIAPRSVTTSTRFGSFTLARSFDARALDSLPVVQIPDWLKTSGAEETWFLTRTLESYTPLANLGGTKKEVFNSHYADFIASADDYLGQYPDNDGTIPILMMLGHLHSFQVGWYWGRSPKLLGKEYEQAIRLLMERHPERLPYILNDLIDMGLPIDWAKSTDLGIKNFEALLFTYQFSPLFGEPKGQLYAFVRDHDQVWKFAPLPTWYDQGGMYQYGVTVQSIADINHDGRDEIVVELQHAYAGGWGLRLHVFTRQAGEWIDRLKWNPQGDPLSPDAYYGSFGIEDNNPGSAQIVVHYYTGAPGGGTPTTIDIYQWDGKVYTNILPIKPQLCSYQAFAEAERRRALGDLKGAIPWYHVARQQNDTNSADSSCSSNGWYTQADVESSYQLEADILKQLTGKIYYSLSEVCPYYASTRPDRSDGLIEIPQPAGIITETVHGNCLFRPVPR